MPDENEPPSSDSLEHLDAPSRFARGAETTPMSAGAGGGWQPPSVEEAAQLFPQYEVLGLLGRGGMGAVYQARQLALDRFVAIKLLPLEISTSRDFADRFTREARTMGKLNHPNIISVYDFGTTTAGHLFFAMEYVEGTNLHELIHGPGLDPVQALALIGEVCDALAYAHGKGVVHRDIKPANVMVNAEGRVKVADFGLARLTDPAAEQLGHTLTGIVMGTPDYMAPEQRRAMNVDHRADIYSLGVMLYEMLCKETPHGVFDPPSARIGIDTRVDEVVMKAMQQTPDRRFQSSTEMKLAVDQIRTTPVPRAVPAAVAAPAAKKSRAPLYAALAAVLVVVLGVIFWPKKKPAPTRIARTTPVAATPRAATPEPAKASATSAPVAAAAPTPVPKPFAPLDTSDWIDLLAAVDLARDPVSGTWTRVGTAVQSDAEMWTRLALPAPPTPEYDLQLEFTQPIASGLVTTMLPWQGRAFQWSMNTEGKYGFERVDGRAFDDGNPTIRLRQPFTVGQRYTVLIAVRNQTVTATIDGELISQVSLPAEIDTYPGWKMKDPRALGVGTFVPTTFHRVAVRAIGAPAPQPVAAAPLDTAGWTDLLAGVEVQRDSLMAPWTKEGGVLRSPLNAARHETILFPVATVPREYDLRLRVSRDAIGFAMSIPFVRDGVGNFAYVAGLDHPLSIDNSSQRQPTKPTKVFPVGSTHDLLIEVRAERIRLLYDGEVADERAGPIASGQGDQWFLPREKIRGPVFGLGVCTGHLTVHAAHLREFKIAPPAPPKPKAAPEVIAWLDGQVATFSAEYQRDATGPFEKALAALRTQYLAQVASGSAAATKAGRLDDSLAWKNEQARLDAGHQPHEADDAPADPAALKTLRENWRKAFAKLDTERFAKAKVVHTKLDALLDRGQTGYTQKQRLDDALLLKVKREELRAAWLVPPVDFSKPGATATAPAATPRPLGSTMAAPVKDTAGLLTGRDAVLHLRTLGADVGFVTDDGTPSATNTATPLSALPRGRLEPASIALRVHQPDGKLLTDADLAKLGPMKKLGDINIAVNGSTGASLAFLADSADLVGVLLNGDALNEAAFEPLLGLRKLTSFTFATSATPVAWTRFGEMASLPNLTYLSITHAETFPPAALARARKLQTFTPGSTKLSEEFIAATAALPSLENLTLSSLDETTVSALRHFDKSPVKNLRLLDCAPLGPHVAAIGKMRKLTALTLDAHSAPDLVHAAGAPALREITLFGAAGYPPATDVALSTIANGFPRLETLILHDFLPRNFSSDSLRALGKLPKLRAFTWGKSKITAEQLAVIATWPALEELTLGGCEITDDLLAALAPAPVLRKLDLSFNGTLTTNCATALKAIKPLRDVQLYSCGFKPTDVEAIRKAIPRIVVRDS